MLKQIDHASCPALSSDIVKAHAWLRDQQDERDERLDEQGADRTQSLQCLRSADGVFRAPLSVFVERGENTACDEETEETTVSEDSFFSAERGDFFNNEFFDFPEQDDYYAQLADHLGIEEDPEETKVSMETVDDSLEQDGPSSTQPVSAHARLQSDGKTVIRIWNRYLKRDRRSWKARSSAEKQHLRCA